MNALIFALVTCAAPPVFSEQDVCYVDVAEPSHAQTLDVYATLRNEDRPVVIWVHGGGWKLGDKSRLQNKVAALVGREDAVLVSVNYRLHPEATYDEQAMDVAAAIAWTFEHAAQYGGDSNKVVVLGHSAGAHLAALATIDSQYLTAFGLRPDDLAGVVLLDGAGYDIPRQLAEASQSRARAIYETVFGTDPETLRNASPLTHVGKVLLPPFYVCHVADRANSRDQSISLVNAIVDAGGQATRRAAIGKTHTTINRDIGTSGDAFSDDVLTFIRRVTADGTSTNQP